MNSGSASGLVSAARTQPQTRPVPVVSVKNGTEVVERGAKRPTFGERRAKQEEQPQDFSIPKYVSHKQM